VPGIPGGRDLLLAVLQRRSAARCESTKVRHYIPDAVVSSYSNTGENPWLEVRAMSAPNVTAQAGGDGTTNHDNESNMAKFKNADR